jgi:hypothetical protein
MRNNFDLLDYFIFPAGILVNTPSLLDREIAGMPEWRK